MTRGSVRREVRIDRPAADVWALVGDPSRVAEWFPGIESAVVDGTTRTITTGNGMPLPEEVLTVDHLLRRFQYRLGLPVLREHTSTIDVFELDPSSCLVVYGCDADPATMALIIGGAAGNALEHLRDLMEGTG